MLLNFEIGDAPLKPQIKFTGGRWRDRIRAQKSAKRRQNSGDQTAPPPAKGTAVHNRDRPLEHTDRPAKRQKLEGGLAGRDTRANGGTFKQRQQPGPSTSKDQPRGSSNSKSQGVTSRLFTSNPAPKTVFEDLPAEDAAEPIQPSNAPLSEEAANFHALGLSRRIAQHLSAKLEMRAPTAIQKESIPQLVNGDSDAFLQAETGSGKTLAYLLPIVHRIMALSQTDQGPRDAKVHRNSGLFAIILAPTRELCKQIATVAEKVLRCAPWIVSTTVIGGESKKSEKARIRKGVNILIATPGRLTDHLDHTEVLDVGTVRWLVLDEGDRLMEMGFENDIKTIVTTIRKQGLTKENKDGVLLDGILPSRRATILCSATMKTNVQRLGEISLEDAMHITASPADADGVAAETNEAIFTAPSQLKQSYIIVPAKLRLVTLIALLKSTFARKGSVMKAIIFISCADSVDFHFDLLKAIPQAEEAADGPSSPSEKLPNLTASTVAPAAYVTSPANPSITLCKLHGSLAQPVRTSTLASFTMERNPTILITTDISSRGLDVPAVDLVIEYDPAFSVADHVHRIGRTARAGRPGKTVLFLQPGCEEGYVSSLHSTSTITPQLYDTILQKGLASSVELPVSSPDDKGAVIGASQREKQSWTSRAESLQLHLEQRLLTTESPEATATAQTSASRQKRGPPDNKLLEAARKAYRSHIRAYATHVREERIYFDITQLHLGHLAKSFGLREAPGGIGGGVQRRTHKPTGHKGNASGRAANDSDDDDYSKGGNNGQDEDAARRMRQKMKDVMNAAGEFNIG